MKFIEKHENIKSLSSFGYRSDEVIKDKGIHRCCKCGCETSFMSMSFNAFFCSEECLDIMWEEYVNTLRKE